MTDQDARREAEIRCDEIAALIRRNAGSLAAIVEHYWPMIRATLLSRAAPDASDIERADTIIGQWLGLHAENLIPTGKNPLALAQLRTTIALGLAEARRATVGHRNIAGAAR